MTKPVPKVSVVVPCYNSELYLKDTIDSILANCSDQLELEIIAVNDCSTDNTLSLLMGYGTAIRVIDKKANEGACRARNDGIRAATGEFIALCDHDDLWEPEKTALQLEKFRDPKTGLVCSDADSFNDQGVLVASMAGERPLRRGMVFSDLLHTNFIVQSSVVIRREVLNAHGLFDEQIFPAEDLDLWLRITRHWQVDYVDKVLVHYRISSTMYSRDKIRMKTARLPVIAKHVRHISDDRCQARILAKSFKEFAMDYWYDRQFAEARAKFNMALKYNRFDFITWVYLLMTYLPVNLLSKALQFKSKVRGMTR